ncbi:hypothetical protein GCM10007967_01790 [Xylanimonas ulmi]
MTLSLALVACGADQPGEVTTTVSPDVSVPKGAPPEPVVPIVWPLTGVATAEVAQRPALAIKVENAREARPLTGLEYADTVWEQTVEGGITRFVAVFHSQIPDVVEPVRSVRPMDAGIVAPLGGILAFSGGQQGFIAEVRAAGVQTVIMDSGDAGFRRDRSRRAPHNVVGTPQTFLDQAAADRAAPPPAQFAFAQEAGGSSVAKAGSPAARLDVTFSRVQRTVWDWDAESSTWLRSDGETAAVSAAGARLSARNVVTLQVRLVDTGTVDPSGAPVPETLMVDSGEGLVAGAGKTIPVRWSKESTAAPLVLTTPEGNPVTLEPGTTWVELVPGTTGSWSVS